MRETFATALTACGAEMRHLMLLYGGSNHSLFEDFERRYPDRVVACGAAESNMIGVAAGLAQSGLRPVAYAINSFLATRCLEQIRVDVCYRDVPVVLAGAGGGLAYAGLGPTHYSCEDIAILRTLPNLTVVCPGDPIETRLALRAALVHGGPVYLRLGQDGEPVVHAAPPAFTIGRGIVVRPGEDVCLLATGSALALAVEVADELAVHGQSAEVVSLHTVKPLDHERIAEAFSRFPVVVTLEEHGVLGGLGGSIAEWLADQPRQRARLLRFGTADVFLRLAGEQGYAREQFGLTRRAIADAVLRLHAVRVKHARRMFTS